MKVEPRRLAAPECVSGAHQYVVEDCDVGIFIYDEPNDAFYSQKAEHQQGYPNWLTQIGVKIFRNGIPKAPDGSDAAIIIGVTRDAPPSNPYIPTEYHAYMVIYPSDLPEPGTEYWFSMAFDPLNIEGTSAYITVTSNAEYQSSSNTWCWCGGNCGSPPLLPCLLYWNGESWVSGSMPYAGNFYSCTQGVGQTTCSAQWRETNPEVGQTINADFTWTDAKKHASGIYCSMGIYNPSGSLVDSYDEETEESGNYTLSVVANVAGDWTCLIAAWTGFAWLYASDVVYVAPGGGDECMASIDPSSIFYTGPFQPGTNQLLTHFGMRNTGTNDCLFYAKFVEYPGEANEAQLGGTWQRVVLSGTTQFIDFYWDTPTGITSWPLGVKLWWQDEPEPPWGSMGTKIFKTRRI